MRSRTSRPRARRSPASSAAANGDWRSQTLSQLRAVIRRADPAAIEETKWRKPSNPAGVPVWSHDGMLCIGDTLTRAVRLTFPRGARIRDPRKLFNARLDSRTVRAIDVHEGERVDEAALAMLVLAAVAVNTAARRAQPGRVKRASR